MGALTEPEIFDCLHESFRIAAECAETLAKSSRKGPTYHRLREHLGLIEGAARQAAAWRADSRWLQIGMLAAEAHKRAGGWLRGYKDPMTGIRVATPAGQQNDLFVMLAANLRALQKVADGFRTKKTGIIGKPILPETVRAERRVGAPVGWQKTKGGVLLPN